MGCIIVSVIAAALLYFDIITVNVYLIVSICSLAWVYIGAGLYSAFGFLKFFYHDFLHWHRPYDSSQWSDGCSDHAICKYCEKDIIQDSQGNWFTFK